MKITFNCILTLTITLAAAMPVMAQGEFSSEGKPWHEGYVNQLFNVQYGSLNPTRLSFNKLQNTGEAVVNYQLQQGGFHNAGKAGDVGNLNVYLGGLKHFSRIDVSGYIEYNNVSYDRLMWNSTLWTRPSNPFTIGDSVPSDGNIEAFKMQAALSYKFSHRLKGGLSAGLATGSLSDQNDPRPKTNTSILPITLGADFALTHTWSVGVSAQARLMSSDISYTVVNPLRNHRFFLMKGMGDYFRRSSGDEAGFQREYKGTTWTAALQAAYRGGAISNFVELSAFTGNEDATDGGAAYDFKGGDYDFKGIKLKNRLAWQPASEALHNFIVEASFNKGTGDWYEQKRITDPDHGNISYYQILYKTRIHENRNLQAQVQYRFDRLNSSGDKNWHASIIAALSDWQQKHHRDDGVYKQQWAKLSIALEGGKAFTLGKGTLVAAATAGYAFPAKDRKFNTGFNGATADDITSIYVARQFEFETSKRLLLGCVADYAFPVSKQLRLGFNASVKSALQQGKAEYYAGLKSTSLTTSNFSVYLNF